MNEYNVIQYVVPEETDVLFSVLSNERNVVIKLFSGSADLCFNSRREPIPINEYELPLGQCLFPRMRANTPCDFLVRGNHYICRASQTRAEVERIFFRVSHCDKSFCFVLNKNAQLQIFVAENVESKVTLKCSGGNGQIFGHILPSTEVILAPRTNFIVTSSDDREFCAYVKGSDRRIKISLRDERALNCMRTVEKNIRMMSLFAKKFNKPGPTVLVVGQTNVGKTSFCHSLLNKAIDEGMKPVYINLDIRRCVPGSISFRKISGRMDVDVVFKQCFERRLHFGSVGFNDNTIKLYYILIRKMGELLTLIQSSNDAAYSPTIIDTCGMIGKDLVGVIQCVLQSFDVKPIVFIGKKRDEYENLKRALSPTVETEFIPSPGNIEPRSEHWETNYLDYSIRNYFYRRTEESGSPNLFIVKIENIVIYRVVTATIDQDALNSRIDDLRIEEMQCDPSLENYVLAFVGPEVHDKSGHKVYPLDKRTLPVTEVQYYVCLREVDLATQTVTVLAPKNAFFLGGSLLMGYLQLRRH